ncbi:MAG: hypothetical protein ACOYEG_08985 [Petrimonas sp.]|jgi:superoxide dismutase
MNEKNNIHTDDEFIRQLMQSTKQQAPENLKYRIMQQIETEKSLLPQQTKKTRRASELLDSFKAIFGTVYVLLAVLVGVAFVVKGKGFLLSFEFLAVLSLIVLVATAFWLLAQVDYRVRRRQE